MRLKYPSAALLLSTLTGCLAPQSSTGKATAEVEPPHTVIPESPRPADAPSQSEAHAFAAASNAFGGDLYARLSTEPGNFAMSPASISVALAMTWAGARGDTQAEMTKVLHLEGDPKALTASAAKMLAELDGPHALYQLSVVNRLFGQSSYPFDASFVALTRDQFGAELVPTDFAHAAEPARADINAYVAQHTSDKIHDLLPRGAVDDHSRLVLVDAVYLNAKWQTPFYSHLTHPDAFHPAEGETTSVPTMHGDLEAGHAYVQGVSVVELPYQGGDLAMTVLVPDEASGLGALEQKIEHGGLDALVAREETKLVRVSLPRFSVETNGAISLTTALEGLGMTKAFSSSGADFSGMTDVGRLHDASEMLHVSGAYHKAFVAVNEVGTEAGAASAVVMSVRGAAPTPAAEVKADHPFLFAIRDKKSGAVLFLGRVVKPV